MVEDSNASEGELNQKKTITELSSNPITELSSNPIGTKWLAKFLGAAKNLHSAKSYETEEQTKLKKTHNKNPMK